ncbi:sulfotransferase domain-containing protein [Rubripirellula amarantea]|nr:sulfotransferase domain-containing protein [Rubripirellula amarantea]
MDSEPKQAPRSQPSLVKRLIQSGRYRFQTSELRHRFVSLRHRGLKPNDVFLASYPKSGNTWIRHLLAHVVTQKPTPWRGGIDQISHSVGRHQHLPSIGTSGRLIKTHEPYRSEYNRSILFVRDGRDVAVSEYFYQKAYSKNFSVYENSFAKFLDLFLQGKTNGYRSWHRHVESWLDAADLDGNDFLVLKFEELKTDTLGCLRKMADYIGIDASDELLHEAVDHCSVKAMQQKEADFWAAKGEANRSFVRTGKSGGWRTHFTTEMERKFWQHAGSAMERCGYERIELSDAPETAPPAPDSQSFR